MIEEITLSHKATLGTILFFVGLLLTTGNLILRFISIPVGEPTLVDEVKDDFSFPQTYSQTYRCIFAPFWVTIFCLAVACFGFYLSKAPSTDSE